MYSYENYLLKTNKEDSKQAWIDWKIEVWGMKQQEAIKASNNPDWGYKKLN